MIKEGSKFEPEIVEIDGEKAIATALRLDGEDNVLLFGRDAIDRIHENPEDTFYNFKPDIGSAKVYCSSCKAYAPEDLALLFLRHLRQKLEKKYFNVADLSKVTDLHCTIGCPAPWDEKRRRNLAGLAEKAGFPNVTCCDEPFGVIYYYHFRGELHLDKPQNILVYDFGGGTTDIAIEEISPSPDGSSLGEPSIQAATGIPDLGGKNFDERLRDHFIEKIGKKDTELSGKDGRVLENYSKQLKEMLSIAIDNGRNTAQKTIPMLHSTRSSHKLEISQNEFQQLCGSFIERFEKPIHEALKNAALETEQIDHVILAGGSSRLYYVEDKIKALFPKSNILRSPNPVEVIAKGLALYGRSLFVTIEPRQGKNVQASDGMPSTEQEASNRANTFKSVLVQNKKWWPAAAVIVIAMVILGWFYSRQNPLSINESAVRHFERGIAYMEGREVAQNRVEAYFHFYLANHYGHAEAKGQLNNFEGRWFRRGLLSREQIETAQRRARRHLGLDN